MIFDLRAIKAPFTPAGFAEVIGCEPRHAQLKLADGVNPFEFGALADTVLVKNLDYDEIAIDAGFKYKGVSLQAEYGLRWLSEFDATGPLPDDSILDHGFFAEAG